MARTAFGQSGLRGCGSAMSCGLEGAAAFNVDELTARVQPGATSADVAGPAHAYGLALSTENEGEDRVRDAYTEATNTRLAEIKAKYDPANMFRFNQNIKPSA